MHHAHHFGSQQQHYLNPESKEPTDANCVRTTMYPQAFLLPESNDVCTLAKKMGNQQHCIDLIRFESAGSQLVGCKLF
jgi:hypothetical protein